MELRYPQKPNGMYILSKEQLDDVAQMVLKEYMPTVLEQPCAVDIDRLAEECLFLTVQHKTLTLNSQILGLTAFGDVRVPCYDDMLRPTEVDITEGTVLIESQLRARDSRARRRFTLAHETSHWILHRSYHSPSNQQYQFRTERSPKLLIACRAENIESSRRKNQGLNLDGDWEEWQADTMAAALLMPIHTFSDYCSRVLRDYGLRKLQLSGKSMSSTAYEIIEKQAVRFSVSKEAAKIRMKQLGFIQYEPLPFRY